MSRSDENKAIIDVGVNPPRHFDIINMNVECWSKIFDRLSLNDILAMSHTCQRMCQIGGHYFRENFYRFTCNLHKFLGPSFYIADTLIQFERGDFLHFIDTVCVCGRLENLEWYLRADLLGSLTTLRLYLVTFNGNDAHGNMLNNIECLELDECYFYGNSIDQLVVSCPKLKCLQIHAVEFDFDLAENRFFERTYPMLEHFQYTDCAELARLPSFLERNPSIKRLCIGNNCLRHIFVDAVTIQLKCLNIEIDSMENESSALANKLKTLHSNDFYKTLHLSISDGANDENYEMFLNEMTSFSALQILCTFKFHQNICHLTGLKELHLRKLDRQTDLETIAINVRNLERLWIEGSVYQFTSFLRNSNTLKLAILDDNNAALNLFHLNRVRQMGGIQQKVRIGVFEWQYLATKWTEQYGNYELIEITRAETIREHFDYRMDFKNS